MRVTSGAALGRGGAYLPLLAQLSVGMREAEVLRRGEMRVCEVMRSDKEGCKVRCGEGGDVW